MVKSPFLSFFFIVSYFWGFVKRNLVIAPLELLAIIRAFTSLIFNHRASLAEVEILLQFLSLFLETSAVNFLILFSHCDYLSFCNHYTTLKGVCQALL